MPISRSKKAVFVHIPKAAGTTIEKAMGMQNSESLYSLKCNEIFKVCPQHLYAEEIKQLHPETEDYYWFAVVQHPFNRLVSEYHYINSTNCRANKYKGLTFEEFVDCLDLPQNDRMFLFDRHLEPQVNFLNKNIEIFKFEKLHNCFDALKLKFKVPFFTHERKSRRDVAVICSNDARDRIIDFYKQDFEAFEYKA